MQKYGMYVLYDPEVDGDDIEPLLWCLRFAIAYHPELDVILRGILSGEEGFSCGGDPGWCIYPEHLPHGTTVYHAITDPGVSDLNPYEGVYDEHVVKSLIGRALRNFSKIHPERTSEVVLAVQRYNL